MGFDTIVACEFLSPPGRGVRMSKQTGHMPLEALPDTRTHGRTDTHITNMEPDWRLPQHVVL